MELEQRSEGEVLVVRPVDKRLDARLAGGFRAQLAELVAAGHHRLVLDVHDVEFIDSSGLGALVAIRKQLGDSGELAICGARETVMSMFKLTRLDKVFEIFADEREAVAALSRGSA
ncbi:MAG: STAS domain-containing protein [Deltaproteobacteria bacterium]|nr:STAS domain-containing protein [Deltaproteobacteria bacterium]